MPSGWRRHWTVSGRRLSGCRWWRRSRRARLGHGGWLARPRWRRIRRRGKESVADQTRWRYGRAQVRSRPSGWVLLWQQRKRWLCRLFKVVGGEFRLRVLRRPIDGKDRTGNAKGAPGPHRDKGVVFAVPARQHGHRDSQAEKYNSDEQAHFPGMMDVPNVTSWYAVQGSIPSPDMHRIGIRTFDGPPIVRPAPTLDCRGRGTGGKREQRDTCSGPQPGGVPPLKLTLGPVTSTHDHYP
jgi:hypothetical protein